MMPTAPSISILVACRNEEENIETCLASVIAAIPDAEVLVIDGGTDRTAELARAMAETHPLIRVLPNPDDRGKGHAIQFGIREARADVMAQFDADLQFEATDLPALVAPLLEGTVDLCIGSRALPGAQREESNIEKSRDWGNALLSAWVSLLVGRRVSDVTTGMKAWTRTAIETIGFKDTAYSYEAELIVRAFRRKLRLIEMPVRYRSRERGESMHRSTLALARAGATIALKSLAARFDRMR